MQVKSVREADVRGKRVLLRVDFNVPIKNGAIADDTRIKAALPTIKWLAEQGATIAVLTHLGRPEGKMMPELSTAPLAARLKELLPDAPITVLENVRFEAGDESGDEAFAKKLAKGYDLFVNDAFAVSHRAHASVVGVTKFLPSYAGFLVEEEITKLSAALTPPKGSVAIIGGAKFETKLPLLTKLLSLYDTLLLGGALGNDLLKARGFPFGASLVSTTPVPIDIATNEKLYVLSDAIVKNIDENAEREIFINDIRAGELVADIGPRTRTAWSEYIENAPFVLWNGPVGICEQGFVGGTEALAQALVASGVPAVIGGGDTIAAVSKFSFDPKKIFLSTGGGAMLEFLANSTLPGLESLKK